MIVDGKTNERRTRWIAKIISAKIDESREAKRIRGSSSEFDKLPNSSLLLGYSNVLGISGGERAFSTEVLFLRKLAPSKYFNDLSRPSLVQLSQLNASLCSFFLTWSISEKLDSVEINKGKEKNRILCGGWELFWSSLSSLFKWDTAVILIVDKKKKIFAIFCIVIDIHLNLDFYPLLIIK